MIRIHDLEKKLSPDFTLRIGDLTIGDGERLALVGVNGSGKSTLLRLLAGRLKPDRGEILFDGPRPRIGYQPQTPYAFRGSAEYNVRLAQARGTDPAPLLEACGLQTLKDRKINTLSGGEKQRVFLARTLAGGFDLLLLDEPLSAADLQTGAALSALLRDFCAKNGTTLVFSTHLPRQAFEIADKILLLDRGAVAEAGDAASLRTPESDFGKLFFAQWQI